MEGKKELFETEAVSFGLEPEEILASKAKYNEALSQCRIPNESEQDLERYKQQLETAFLC